MKAQFFGLSSPSEKTVNIKQVDQNFLDNPLHFHEVCELVLILESYGKRVVGNHVASFTAGDLVLMGPNIPHIWRNDDIFLNPLHEARARAIVLYFPADFLLSLTDDQSTILAMQKFINKAKRGLRFYGETLEKATELIKSLIHKQGFSRITGFLNLIELLHQTGECENLASEGYKPTFGQQETNRINDVYIYIMQNFREEILLSKAAEIANMTPNAFCRFFKYHTQKPFSKFINEMRIGHASKLLMNSQLSVSEVCYQSGYQNLTNFNKFFKMIMGKSPRAYRKDMNI